MFHPQLGSLIPADPPGTRHQHCNCSLGTWSDYYRT